MQTKAKCESPIEEKLLDLLSWQIHDGVKLEGQVPVAARSERYRVDFMLERDGRRAVVECDGRDFHDYWTDNARDLAMLDAGGVSEVYRFRGCDIVFDPDSCIRFMRGFGPWLFESGAGPLGLGDKVMQSKSLADKPDKPIHRCRAPMGELLGIPAALREVNTFIPRGRCADGESVMVEFKTSTWDRKYDGPRAWSLGDVLNVYGDQLLRPE